MNFDKCVKDMSDNQSLFDNEPLVSILIPTYNQSEYISTTVQSALGQTYNNIEVVVCDDASTDSTPDVLSRLSDSRLKVSRNISNLARVGNYRRCLHELARGEWVLMLDGDDYLYDPTYIEKAINLIGQKQGIDLVFSNILRRRDNLGGILETNSANKRMPPLIDGKDLFLMLADENISIFHCTTLFRRQKAVNLDFYRENILSSDWESIHRYILTGKVAHIDMIASVWRYHENNATRNRTAQERIENLAAIINPYDAAKLARTIPYDRLDRWLYRYLYKTAITDVRKILKQDDLIGYRQYMQYLRIIHPRVYRNVKYSPRSLLKYFRLLILKILVKSGG